MKYKNIDIKVFDQHSLCIMHCEFSFMYIKPKDDSIYSNLGGLQCNFEEDSEEYNQLYNECLKIAQNTLKTIYDL